jgi:hypothetical protein
MGFLESGGKKDFAVDRAGVLDKLNLTVVCENSLFLWIFGKSHSF